MPRSGFPASSDDKKPHLDFAALLVNTWLPWPASEAALTFKHSAEGYAMKTLDCRSVRDTSLSNGVMRQHCFDLGVMRSYLSFLKMIVSKSDFRRFVDKNWQLAMKLLGKALIVFGIVYAIPAYMVMTFILNLKKRAITVWVNPSSDTLQKILAACPSLLGPACSFRPTCWLFNGHLQTFWSGRDRAAPRVTYARQLLKTADGGKSALDWAVEAEGVPEQVWEGPGRPVLLLVPGLTGTSAAAYVRRAVATAVQRGWACGVVNHRGLGGVQLSSAHVYSAGFTGDLRLAVQVARDKVSKDSPILLGGFSLGGNILAKYLGEEGSEVPVVAAFAVGQPFDLVACDQFMRSGPLNQHFYSRGMAEHLRRAVSLHDVAHLEKVDWAATKAAQSVRDFDRAFTIKMFGYRTTDHYYREASSAPFLHRVRVPLLCLNAEDDPIIPATAIPYEEAQVSSHVAIAVTALGGHVGHFEDSFGAFGSRVLASFVLVPSN
eukprot:jgi/Botrbrau1/18181/Bobra.53_1s0048.2